jgi:hypothetical protein
MSRDLPARPNLEHLKKQAKDLLPELQQRNPALKLADAQHAIAREYGFASWPQLHAHVAALQPPADSAAAPVPSHPFAGTWTADVPRSTRHPANPFRSATIQFSVSGNIVTITDVYIDEAGRAVHGKNTIQADGKEQASEHGHGYSLAARWLGWHGLEAVARKDGEVVGRVTYEVSADGTTLTISSRETAGFSADSADHVIVLTRPDEAGLQV